MGKTWKDWGSNFRFWFRSWFRLTLRFRFKEELVFTIGGVVYFVPYDDFVIIIEPNVDDGLTNRLAPSTIFVPCILMIRTQLLNNSQIIIKWMYRWRLPHEALAISIFFLIIISNCYFLFFIDLCLLPAIMICSVARSYPHSLLLS